MFGNYYVYKLFPNEKKYATSMIHDFEKKALLELLNVLSMTRGYASVASQNSCFNWRYAY